MMRTSSKRGALRFGDERGQALVEFAILLPIFLLLVLGMIDLARAWNAHQVVTDAAREACRTAVVDDPTITYSDVVAVAETALSNAGFDPSSATISVPGYDGPRGDPTSVNITYPYTFQWMGIFMSLVGGSTINLQTQVTMRNE